MYEKEKNKTLIVINNTIIKNIKFHILNKISKSKKKFTFTNLKLIIIIPFHIKKIIKKIISNNNNINTTTYINTIKIFR